MTRRARSLKTRLVALMGLLFICGAIAIYLAARAYGQRAADMAYDQLLQGSAAAIAETLSVNGATISVDIPYTALGMLSAAPEDRVFYRVMAPDGSTVTGYDDLPGIALPPRRSGEEVMPQTRFFDAPYRGEKVRFALLGREVAQPELRGWIWVQIGQTRRAREVFARRLVVSAIAPITIVMTLALLLAWIGVGRAFRPLHEIGADLSRRAPSDLHPLATAVPVEINPLVRALNEFMRRLAENNETLRAFIAEAAHQVRTPMAALRAQLQVALDEEDPVELRARLDAVERNARHMTRLLNQLLSDATVKHREGVRSFEPLDLVTIVQQAIRETVSVLDDAPVSFVSSVPEAPLAGDAILLREAVKNLIDNALQHGIPTAPDPSAEIEVSLEATEEGYCLAVADRGPGIPPEQRERVLARFVRGDSTAPGAGLGMAIVRRVVRTHGGTLELLDRPGGGLMVQIRLRRSA